MPVNAHSFFTNLFLYFHILIYFSLFSLPYFSISFYIIGDSKPFVEVHQAQSHQRNIRQGWNSAKMVRGATLLLAFKLTGVSFTGETENLAVQGCLLHVCRKQY